MMPRDPCKNKKCGPYCPYCQLNDYPTKAKTPYAIKIWKNVEKVAEKCPEWMKKRIGK